MMELVHSTLEDVIFYLYLRSLEKLEPVKIECKHGFHTANYYCFLLLLVATIVLLILIFLLNLC